MIYNVREIAGHATIASRMSSSLTEKSLAFLSKSFVFYNYLICIPLLS
jgi:hypothetical protein